MASTSFQAVWRKGCEAVGIDRSWTQHRTRGQVYDAGWRAGVDRGTMRRMVGHGSEQLQERYETIGMEDLRQAGQAVRGMLVKKEGA